LQNSLAWSVTGSRRSCTGASQRGSSPAVDSMRMAKKRSSEPKIARWTMMGWRRPPCHVVCVLRVSKI